MARPDGKCEELQGGSRWRWWIARPRRVVVEEGFAKSEAAARLPSTFNSGARALEQTKVACFVLGGAEVREPMPAAF
jgi:hypothetical protein